MIDLLLHKNSSEISQLNTEFLWVRNLSMAYLSPLRQGLSQDAVKLLARAMVSSQGLIEERSASMLTYVIVWQDSVPY